MESSKLGIATEFSQVEILQLKSVEGYYRVLRQEQEDYREIADKEWDVDNSCRCGKEIKQLYDAIGAAFDLAARAKDSKAVNAEVMDALQDATSALERAYFLALHHPGEFPDKS